MSQEIGNPTNPFPKTPHREYICGNTTYYCYEWDLTDRIQLRYIADRFFVEKGESPNAMKFWEIIVSDCIYHVCDNVFRAMLMTIKD